MVADVNLPAAQLQVSHQVIHISCFRDVWLIKRSYHRCLLAQGTVYNFCASNWLQVKIAS
jgi:hypothetical protein